MIMDYESITNGIMASYQHPCDSEIPPGYYRRIKWEGHTENYPSVGVQWDTEIIPIGTHLYTREPFGHRSDDLPVINPPSGGTESDSGGSGGESSGILVAKIGYYFDTQAQIDAYIASIGATKINGQNDWYGADLSKSNLFKNPGELAMYRVENSGGYLLLSGPLCDQRIRQTYNPSTGAFTNVDYYWSGNRIAYMKHDDSEAHQCKYVGMAVNTNADTIIPPIPPSKPSVYGALPSELMLMSFRGIGCIPATVGFAYTNISDAMLKAWNETRHTFKLVFDMLTGAPKNGDGIATMFDRLSVSMEEVMSGALALSQQAWQMAIKVFKDVISSALNIVGGAWEMIKSYLPSVTILGVSISVYDLIFGENSVQYLKDTFSALIKAGKETYESVINAIYAAIGSAYNYAVEYVKAGARDLVDACSALFDWCITMFQNACVALVDLYGRIMQLWSMPPIVPNPLWAAVLAIRNILRQIKPLDIILSGNFPGFTAMDLYQMAQEKVKQFIDESYAQIKVYYEQAQSIYKQLTSQTSERDSLKRRFEQYKNWMYEAVTDATTKAYEMAIDAANAAIAETKALYESVKAQIQSLKDAMKDTYSLAMEQLKKLPIMAQINEFLGYCGIAFDSLLETYDNAVAGAKSLYKNFVDSSRSFKDTCKVIYNQICTLALSKVTQYVNKLLSLIGLSIVFGEITICVPTIQY